MAWIKRNLFFAIGGVIALLLLGAAGYYDFTSWSRNSAAFDKLNETYDTLRTLTTQKPSPGNEKINNTETARAQEKQLREWIQQSGSYFEPITPIPDPASGAISSESLAAALRRTIDQLQHEADAANVTLPPQYDFSFAAERSLVKFASGSFDALPQQLGEVKSISEILFAAHVNALDGVQRIRVSDDDAAGPQSDYIDDRPATTDLAVIIPYVVTFRAFSAEIGQVLAGFASSPHGFIVKSINIQPAGTASVGSPGAANASAGAPPQGQPLPNNGGLQTVLKEQLLRVTIEVEIVKLTPKS